MLIPFEQLPDSARIWIYQLGRALNGKEKDILCRALDRFCSQWHVHGNDLPSSHTLKYDRFLVLGADEGQLPASGCSIDSSVHVLKDLQSQLKVDFFSRAQSAVLIDGNVVSLSQQSVEEKLQSGEISGDTLTFNNLITAKKDLNDKWIIRIKESWLARHLPKSTLA